MQREMLTQAYAQPAQELAAALAVGAREGSREGSPVTSSFSKREPDSEAAVSEPSEATAAPAPAPTQMVAETGPPAEAQVAATLPEVLPEPVVAELTQAGGRPLNIHAIQAATELAQRSARPPAPREAEPPGQVALPLLAISLCVRACVHARHLIARLMSGHVSRRCLCVIVVLERDDVGVIELLHDAQLSIAVSRILQHAFDRHLCTETMYNAR